MGKLRDLGHTSKSRLRGGVGTFRCGSIVLLLALVGCSASRSEPTYVTSVPTELKPSYELFAKRCSKCHSLSRPLDSGIEDDAYWAIYVRRMRLQPGSGISAQEEVAILEYLKFYARERRERRERGSGSSIGADGGQQQP